VFVERCVTQEVIVNLPPAAAWQRLRDLSKAHYYVHGVTDTRIDTQSTSGIGTSRTVFLKGQPPMQETVIEWREGSGFVLNLHRGGKSIAPFERAEFTYTMTAADLNRTRLRLEMRYSLGNWLARLMDQLFLRAMVRTNLRHTAANLQRYYETGVPANPDIAKHS
jgi:hypothetical protein